MPKELGECGYEAGSEGKIMSVMTSDHVVTYEDVCALTDANSTNPI